MIYSTLPSDVKENVRKNLTNFVKMQYIEENAPKCALKYCLPQKGVDMTFKKKFKSILKELYNTTESISFFLCEEPIPTMFHITYDEPVQLKSLAVKKGNNWVQEVNIYSMPQETFLSLFANKVFLPLPYDPKNPYKYTDALTANPLPNTRPPTTFANLFSGVNYNAIDVRTLNGR